MIIHVSCLIFQQVIRWFFDLPGHQDIALWKLTDPDWMVLEDLEMVLEVRFAYPKRFFTTNLSMICPRFLMVHSTSCLARALLVF